MKLESPFFGVIAGIILAQFFIFNKTLGLKLILAFSGAILLGVYVFKLFPEIFSKADDQLSIYVMGGVFYFKLDLNISLREESMDIIIQVDLGSFRSPFG